MATVKTNQGKALTAIRMSGSSPSLPEPLFLGVGTGAGTAVVGDTTLFTEYVGSPTRQTMAPSFVSSGSAGAFNDLYRLIGTFTNNSGGSLTITNAGNFTLISGGVINIKGDFAVAPILAIGDSLQVTIDERFA